MSDARHATWNLWVAYACVLGLCVLLSVLLVEIIIIRLS